jgi:hypothetical protein
MTVAGHLLRPLPEHQLVRDGGELGVLGVERRDEPAGARLHGDHHVSGRCVTLADLIPQVLETGGDLPDLLETEHAGRPFDGVGVTDQILDLGGAEPALAECHGARDQVAGTLLQLVAKYPSELGRIQIH